MSINGEAYEKNAVFSIGSATAAVALLQVNVGCFPKKGKSSCRSENAQQRHIEAERATKLPELESIQGKPNEGVGSR